MGINRHSNREKTDPDKLASGLTIREWFTGMFASSGCSGVGLTPKECVANADEVIQILNEEVDTD